MFCVESGDVFPRAGVLNSKPGLQLRVMKGRNAVDVEIIAGIHGTGGNVQVLSGSR
jgi:hypothetical protein